MWHRLAETLKPWYEKIWRACKDAAMLNADQTGWHLNGVLVWLWCFCTTDSTYYVIDESRGHAALEKFFAEDFNGILVTDFWRAYDAVEARMNQKCWAHLLRELKTVDERPNGPRDAGDPDEHLPHTEVAWTRSLGRNAESPGNAGQIRYPATTL